MSPPPKTVEFLFTFVIISHFICFFIYIFRLHVSFHIAPHLFCPDFSHFCYFCSYFIFLDLNIDDV